MNTDLKYAVIGAIAAILAAIIVGLFGLFQGKYSKDADTVEHAPQQTTIGDNSQIVSSQDAVVRKDKQSDLKIDTTPSTRSPTPKYIGFYSEQHQPETRCLWNTWDNTGSFAEKSLAGSSGDKFQKFTINTNINWFGFGLEKEIGTVNVNDFKKGRLHFAIRCPEIMSCLGMLEIGIQSRALTDKNMKEVNSWLSNSVAKCRTCKNNWSCCAIEIEQFTKKEADLDIGSISQMIMLRSRSVPASTSNNPLYLDVDEIYWSMP